MKELRLRARAKINLGLDVVRKRDDGYHEVRMIMQTINLYDKILLQKRRKPGITVTTNLGFLPVNQDNLVYKAAQLLMDEFSVEEGLNIDLQKYIPVAAGMAGGSSDAAAVLVGVNRMFRLGLSKQELMERSVKIGADVPFCVMRGTALAEGIGEKLTPLPELPDCFILIAKPKVFVSTKFVYGNLKANELKEHPQIDAQIDALNRDDLHAVAKYMGNVLETVTIPEYPVIEEIKRTMLDHGALNSMMSGSGPTVFGLFEKREDAQKAYNALLRGEDAKQVYLIEQSSCRRVRRKKDER
ncbi:MAG: 4-(cytidine 5'-diphospho)-2-C-methyl-D-erythritol kinase [Eubacteriales bacterium]|nr:4-(cytidine 5'-diphospho)-2-C-methyl-D-erythritol kinase [Eubacteriales bacterium]